MWVWFNYAGVFTYVGVAMAVQVCFCFLQPCIEIAHCASPTLDVHLSTVEMRYKLQKVLNLQDVLPGG